MTHKPTHPSPSHHIPITYMCSLISLPFFRLLSDWCMPLIAVDPFMSHGTVAVRSND